MIRVTPSDVYDGQGNLTRIDFYTEDGKCEIDALWDPSDPQDSEHRTAFRKWAYDFIERNKEYKVVV